MGALSLRGLARAGLLDGLRTCCLWLCASCVAWGLVLATEVAHSGPAGDSALGEIAYLLHLALLYSGFGSLPVAGMHLFRLGIARLLGPGARAEIACALAVALLALPPASRQAEFLTSGSDISTWEFAETLRYGLLVAIVASYVALWTWHRLGLREDPERPPHRRLPRLLLRAAWVLTGLAALSALVYIVSFELKAYAFFAAFLVLPAWFIAATLGYALARRLPLRPSAPLWALLLLIVSSRALSYAAPRDLSRARNGHMRRGKVAAWTDLIVYPSDTRFASFEIADAARFRCDPRERPARPPPLDLPARQRQNVLLVSIDALRADAVRWAVDDKPLMPALQAFAGEGIEYRRAVTTYPATLLALGGALTGLGPSQILFSPVVPDNLFDLTRRRFELRRILLPKSAWFRKRASRKLLLSGAKVSHHRSARKQTSALIDELRDARRHRRRVMTWIHYYEPHQKYKKHKGFDFGDDERARYMSELSYVDRELGRLIGYLRGSGYLKDSLVIVFADHGQALGEQDYFGHHVYLNSWITDIPLIVRAPGQAPRVSYAMADVTDVAATVLHYVGRPAPPQTVGMSLLLPDAARRGRTSFAEAFPVRGKSLFSFTRPVESLDDFRERMDRIHQGARNYLPKVSVVTADHRLIVNRVTGLEEFYDRRRDPQERDDLSDQRLPAHRALRGALSQWSREHAERLYCSVATARASP